MVKDAHLPATRELFYVHADHLDRPIMMTGAGAVVRQAGYLPYSGVHQITGLETQAGPSRY